ncbi:MAG: GNAT family N-acetyltransferase [Thermoguttaceae bacterium]
MNQPRIVQYESLAALRAAAGSWDDLWLRSDTTLPSLRAELLAQWIEQFAAADAFRAVAIEQQGRLVAALPLVQHRLRGVLNVAAMPCNEWSASGDLLLDASLGETATPVLQLLVTAIRQLPLPLLWLNEATLDSERWQSLRQAMAEAGMTVVQHPRWQVGRVAIDHDWPAYKARWSRKHRQQMAQAARKLAQEGDVRLVIESQPLSDAITASMLQCFDIEERSWKGAAGGAVLRHPTVAEFFIRQAEQAAQWGQFELALLHCGDRPVAFSYGLSAKGVFHSLKTGYDPDFARHHPGQLLRYYLLERLYADPTRKALDFLGPMTSSHAAWLPQRYSIGRLAVATRGVRSRVAVWSYQNVWLRYRRMARENSGSSRCK